VKRPLEVNGFHDYESNIVKIEVGIESQKKVPMPGNIFSNVWKNSRLFASIRG